jgi:hypothetical protein
MFKLSKSSALLYYLLQCKIVPKALLFSQHGKEYQRSYVTKNGLIFNSLAGVYFMSVISTALTCKYSYQICQRPQLPTVVGLMCPEPDSTFQLILSGFYRDAARLFSFSKLCSEIKF